MSFRESLNQTMIVFGIRNKDLSNASGVAAREISLYRNGKKDITTKTFYRLVSSFPPEARAYLLALSLVDKQENAESIRV